MLFDQYIGHRVVGKEGFADLRLGALDPPTCLNG